MWTRRAVTLAIGGGALAGCGPDLSGLHEAGRGAITAVPDGHTLELGVNTRLRLGEVIAPRGREAGAGAAQAGLEALTLGRMVRFAAIAPAGADWPVPVMAYVRSEAGRWLWLQEALALDGLVRVLPQAGDAARVAALLGAEASARAESRGLWAERGYAIRSADRPAAVQEGMALVDGTVRDVGVRPQAQYLNFGEDWSSDFTVRIPTAALEAFTAVHGAPTGLVGQAVLVRGIVRDAGGPAMELIHPAQLERLTPA
jgi:endonuclease YncB( thermonuclease family)